MKTFIDPYAFTPEESEAFLNHLAKHKEFHALLDKFISWKTAVLRDRAMSTEDDDEMKEFKWGAAAVFSFGLDIHSEKQRFLAKQEEKIKKKSSEETKTTKKSQKRIFGPGSDGQ